MMPDLAPYFCLTAHAHETEDEAHACNLVWDRQWRGSVPTPRWRAGMDALCLHTDSGRRGMKALRNRAEPWFWRRVEDRTPPPRWATYLVLAEDDWGDLLLPCLGRRNREHGHGEPWWDRPFRPRDPLHWPYALLTALTGWIVMVAADG